MIRPKDGRVKKSIAAALRDSFPLVPKRRRSARTVGCTSSLRATVLGLLLGVIGGAFSPAALSGAVSTNRFYTVTPCRLFDSRNPAGPFGGPALSAGAIRSIVAAGECGLSPTANAVSINLTVTQPTNAGHLTLFPAGAAVPNVSTVNFRANQTRANNALVSIGVGGAFSVFGGLPSGSVQFIVDLNGYFDDPANNQPPSVSAGPPQTVHLADVVNLAGSATDDGKPSPTLTTTWSKLVGPGTVTFGNAANVATTATFSALGSYVLRLTANDGALLASSDVQIIVNPPGTAVRFLQQATFGPTDALLNRVGVLGFVGFLDEQINMPSSGYPSLPPEPDSVPPTCNATCQRDKYSMYPLQNRFFLNALYSDDQLRQRVAWALHQLLVVSGRDVPMPSRVTPYLQAIDRNVFGNFRQLLADITLNPAMGIYLDMATSTKNNPNENYGREILQLFSVGTELLKIDGTSFVDGSGDPLPTYDQTVVSGFAKVFTGWTFATNIGPGITNYQDPMVLNASNHDTTAKAVLGGVTLPAGHTGLQDLNDALDNIFNHPNAGPFISTHLIHCLVTSNPSPAYVTRVATVFNDNGAGVRGDLAAVVKAILLDPEARDDTLPNPQFGRLKDPILFVTNVLRPFSPLSANRGAASDGVLNPQTSSMGLDVLRPATVFSYYPADFLLPGSTTLNGPEFGILSASTALKRANFVNTIVFSTIAAGGNTPSGTSIDLTGLRALAGNPAALVDELNRSLMAGQMSAAMRTSLIQAVSAVSAQNSLLRAQQALYLVATSSQFQVQR